MVVNILVKHYSTQMTKKEQAIQFKEILLGHFQENLVSVVLFGSVARGEDRLDSDIDMLLVFKALPSGRLARRALLDFAWDQMPQDCVINPVLKTVEEAKIKVPLYLDMVEEGILLLDRDDFFAGVLNSLKQTLKKNKAVKKWIGKIYYWDLKPDARMGDVVEIL